jgi:hypothetical protein
MMATENIQAVGRVAEVQVSGLVGPALDWAVWLAVNGEPGEACRTRKLIFTADRAYWKPSENWFHGGPLVEEHQVSLHCPQTTDDVWAAWIITNKGEVVQPGDTALIAACRAIVAAHLGEVVSVPAELVENK